MDDAQITRRDFLADYGRLATGGWVALQLPWLGALASCAREDARKGAAPNALTLAEARAMRAFAAQIIPSDDGAPGAEEAGAVHFVDRAFDMPFFSESVPVVRAGLADLDVRARAVDAHSDFASLPHAQQLAVLRAVEHTPFFRAARTLVVIGTFAEPSYGGNKDGVGWTMIGIDHRPSYATPFGWYDARSGDAAKNVA